MFGLSRPTYYQAQAAFERDGMAGLLPRTRGPKSAHKLTHEVMRLIEQALTARASPLQAARWQQLVQAETRAERCIHAASNERWRGKKNDETQARAPRAGLPIERRWRPTRGCAPQVLCAQARRRGRGRDRVPRSYGEAWSC